MKIAVLTRRELTFHWKESFRSLSRFEKLAICLVSGDDLHPLDVVFLFHRVRNAADFYFEPTRDLFLYRDMLFLRRVDGVLDESFHRLAATNEFAFTSVNHFHDVAAHFAFVNF